MTLKLYDDAAGTSEVGASLVITHETDLSDNPQDFQLWYAEVDEDTGDNGIFTYEASSNPGVDQISISIGDTAPGSGHEAAEITLGLTAGDLATNTAGASLDIGTSFLSGASNAETFYMRVENAVTTVSNSLELSVARNALLKSSTP